MFPAFPRHVATATLFSACAVLAQSTAADEPEATRGHLIAANYGSANLPANLGVLVCDDAPGRDGIPVHFETEVNEPVYPEDFIVRGESGDIRPVFCVTFEPSDDVGDKRSILLVGDFGDADDQPASVEVVGDIWSTDFSLSYQGAYTDIIPLEAPPSLILAEVVPEEEWDLDNPGTPIPWGGGTGCPSEGTEQVLRVAWGGGILAVGGTEVTAQEWKRYTIAMRTEAGDIKLVKPFAVGDLNDQDNNHELCLDQRGTPLAVRFPAGLLVDPNNDVNERTRIRVNHDRDF
ncbi:MAG: hypothetical protein N838_12090 [Thiohalocapsa sp. PB-PSB1]|jgi:hypothetical protein|nr:MAG: hypothetical protein N838_12090 [Thiohalocapsa sp. PB-PSB1]